MKAWHFVGDRLRNGDAVPADGERLHFDGEPILCERGLHASRRLIDALQYAPGNTVCRVECSGKILHGDDKLVCTSRSILWRLDAEALLRVAARRFALDVADQWDCPDVVMRFLKTGDESLRWAAATAARSWADSAARMAARSAADWAAAAAFLAGFSAARSAANSAALWAARSAGHSPSQEKQNRMLTGMVCAEHRKATGEGE